MRRRSGFSLVELLVIVGIIAVLVSILLPSLARVKESGRRVTCAGHLRQLMMAFAQYAQANDDHYPFAARLDNVPQGVDYKEDWIHWQKQTPNQSIDHSAIAPYVGARGQEFVALMRCPSDAIEEHANANTVFGAYPYSYTMNGYYDPSKYPQVRVTAVRHPSEKILLVEENVKTINDGGWFPADYLTGQVSWDYLSIRHDLHAFEHEAAVVGNLTHLDKHGNAAFVDGHVDYITRAYSRDLNHLEAQR